MVDVVRDGDRTRFGGKQELSGVAAPFVAKLPYSDGRVPVDDQLAPEALGHVLVKTESDHAQADAAAAMDASFASIAARFRA